MSSPHQIRELALQALFTFDAQNRADAELANEIMLGVASDAETIRQATKMATAAWDARTTADAWSTRLAPQWPTHRQPGVDRALLRLAIWELTSTQTPPKVVIDEAIELAKEFSTANSPSFVNGVLDAVLKEVAALKQT